MMEFWAEYRKYISVAILAGVIIDIIVGDPAFLLHPVQIIGKLIEILEKLLRGKKVTETGEDAGESGKVGSGLKDFVLGVIEVMVVVAVTGGVSFGICYLAYRINTYLLLAVMSVMCWQCIAARSLRDAAIAVYVPLSKGDVEGARKAVSMIVGRDTQSLDDKGIAKAAVETVAENTNDGVICPLFYQMLGGPVLSYVYKAVSTMDSMIGYKNDRYMYFGRAAAKTDDVFAYVPARLSAVFMIAGTALLEVCGALFGKNNSFNYSTKNAAGIFVRDRYNHASPNSAQCESVCAGALGLKLAGPASYFGKLHDKKFIGDEHRPIESEDIKRSILLMNMTTALFVIIYVVIYIFVKLR
ncbi:adenosylcobinamide-phosphate synthase CbiB [Butyrivibrio sp. AE2005]|uniref:adenosylcobinamide-phosphate synthase CbiB n=1 Tax=Butyrivibrio sp. AE2005 TaxID=1496722 RepID=UPI001FA7CC45|nr:adenosylcobinamide-phosphate synthase CbiB [Butyrivibrio sp. AE2005]